MLIKPKRRNKLVHILMDTCHTNKFGLLSHKDVGYLVRISIRLVGFSKAWQKGPTRPPEAMKITLNKYNQG